MQAPHKEHLYKLLVIGDLGVGKTSIIKRYVHQNFSSHYRATIGVDFALKVLHWDPETVVRLQLWDIAGEPPGEGRGHGGLAAALQFRGGGAAGRSRAPARDFSWCAENLVSEETKVFLSRLLKLQVHSLALWRYCSNSLAHPPLGSLDPVRASPGTQGETVWSSRSLALFPGVDDAAGDAAPSVMPATKGEALRPVNSGQEPSGLEGLLPTCCPPTAVFFFF